MKPYDFHRAVWDKAFANKSMKVEDGGERGFHKRDIGGVTFMVGWNTYKSVYASKIVFLNGDKIMVRGDFSIDRPKKRGQSDDMAWSWIAAPDERTYMKLKLVM